MMWLLYAPPVPLVRCGSVHNLPAHADGVLGLWLSGEPAFVAEWLVDIRHQSSHAHLPVLVDCELPADLQHLSDGYASSADMALQAALDWRPSVSRLQGATTGSGLALIRYLYLRPLVALSPARDWIAHQAYRYPLLEAFVDGETPASLLAVVRSRGWLEQNHLVDRLRCCSECQSVHLNYVDMCPGCKSLNVEESAYIHCFTCSHLAPESAFIRNGALICPNCHARLRHIGVDYNRPLEQLHCRDCTLAFADALVQASCLACGQSYDPEKLCVLNVASYSLSDAGRLAARQGAEVTWNLRGSVRTQGMMPEVFIDLADWMMHLARRHEQAGFVLLGIYLHMDGALDSFLGEAGQHALLEAFAFRLRELTRETDVLTRINDHLFWMLLPQTSREGGKAILEKIAALAECTTQADGSRLEVRGVIHADADIPAEATAEHVLKSFEGRLQRGLPC